MDRKPEIYDIPLHDIKPLVEIQEYSLVYLVLTSIVVFIFLVAILYLALRWLKNRNRFNLRKEHLKLLKSVDFRDSKKAAYDVTYYASTFENDTPEHQIAFENLQAQLENYKYKKDVDVFDGAVKKSLEEYLGMLNV